MINRRAQSELLSFARNLLLLHPRRITALVAALLIGGAGGAYALAALAPDAADLTVRQVVETVQPLPLNIPADLQQQALKLFRSDTTRSTDTADTLLQRLGVDDAPAASFIRTDSQARQLLGRSGRSVTVETSERNSLLKLSARWAGDKDGNFSRLVIERTDHGGFTSRVETAPLTASTRLASGSIQSSLFAATDDAKIPDAVATQMAEIFAGDIDFHRALRKGDRFAIVYETLEADGEPMRAGRVLSAEFVNNGKTFQAVWFQDPTAGNKGAYYTPDGQSLHRAFLASPLEFSRITSGFKMRMHPILHTMRAHQGVDYGAPTGTPVRSVGDGVVEFAGVQNGYGNVIILKHADGHNTVYAHLSRINVHKGEKVSQSQNIGAVGATGWATGPHLHFEYRLHGVYQDPLTVARVNETVPLAAAARPAFAQLAAQSRVALSAAASLQQANAQ